MGWVGTPERLYRFRAASLSPRRRMASLRDVTTLFDETARAFFRRADAVPLITGTGFVRFFFFSCSFSVLLSDLSFVLNC